MNESKADGFFVLGVPGVRVDEDEDDEVAENDDEVDVGVGGTETVGEGMSVGGAGGGVGGGTEDNMGCTAEGGDGIEGTLVTMLLALRIASSPRLKRS
jgi:hypothetical protein